MESNETILDQARKSAKKKLLFLPHAIRQMSRPDRIIAPSEVREIINNGEVIEDYPENLRGHSCLILGFSKGERPIHVVCSPKEEYLAIITSYVPDPNEWETDFKTRKEL